MEVTSAIYEQRAEAATHSSHLPAHATSQTCWTGSNAVNLLNAEYLAQVWKELRTVLPLSQS